jgi:hypothetical protein
MSTPTSPAVSPEPLVSIVAICYDQEPFIRETLDGFLAQQVDFPFEVVVADDASTDATASIVAEYAAAHPDVFRPILRSENVGVQANLVGALQASRGRYVALCEGDDYWTDVTKLARQVALLEARPEVSVCFHRVQVRRPGEPDTLFPAREVLEDPSLSRLLHENFIQTNSVVYRRLPDYSSVPHDVLPLDWYLHVMHALTGSIAALPEVMSVYRRHEGGIWWGSDVAQSAFWSKHGPAMTRMCDAVLELVDGQVDAAVAAGAMREQALLTGTQLRLAEAHGGPAVAELVRASPRWADRWLVELERTRQDVHDRLEATAEVAAERLELVTRLGDDVSGLNTTLAETQDVVLAKDALVADLRHQLAERQDKLVAKRDEVNASRRRTRRQADRIERLGAEVAALRAELDKGVTRGSARRSARRAARVVRRVAARRRGATSS